MIIGLKEIVKLFSISIVTCCAVFVCTMFLNYNIDLATVDGSTLSAAGKAIYDAQLRSVYKELHADRETGC